MRCLGYTKKFTRCKKNSKLGFCNTHRFQPIILLITLGTTFIWMTDLFNSVGLDKKPLEYIYKINTENEDVEIITKNIDFPLLNKFENEYFIKISFKNISENILTDFNCKMYLE